MNSAYGKTIQKPILKETICLDSSKRREVYWSKNYFSVVSDQCLGNDHWMLDRLVETDEQYVPALIGVLILSMSKRIMNEVICLAEDNGINIYYQDTDSVHMFKKDLTLLSSLFKEKYQRELVGNNLGQFHSDFPPVNGKESWSKESIILGKKAYLDVLTNEDGDIDYHVRMKGIPSEVVKATADDNDGLRALYMKLYEGDEVEFNLLCCRSRFKMHPNMHISTVDSFMRKISFN